MANTQNTQSNPAEAAQKKQSNVTEFNSQSSKGDTSSSRSKSKGDGATGAATATARSFYDQAKETAGQAYEVVTDKAATKLDEQKSTLSGGLGTVADSVRQVGQNLGSSKTDSGLAEAAAKYTNTAAQKIENAASYFDSHSVRDMARDLEGFARRNPALFLGAAFGLGFLAARFLKSTPPRYDDAPAKREVGTSAGTSRQLNSPSSQTSASDFAAKSV